MGVVKNTVVFNDIDKTEFTLYSALSESDCIQGAQRSILRLQFKKDVVNFNLIEQITAKPENLRKIDLVDYNDENLISKSCYEYYSARTSISIDSRQVDGGDGIKPPVYEEIINVVLAQLSYAEVQNAEYEEQIADLQAAIAAGAFGGAE